jgi:hypothetical protein
VPWALRVGVSWTSGVGVVAVRKGAAQLEQNRGGVWE